MIALLIAIVCLMIIVGQFAKKGDYVVGNRDLGVGRGAMSIAATWIWAPALFVSTQQAYVNGYVGFLFFLVPNILTLWVFARFAQRLRDRNPDGYNFPEVIGSVSNRVKKLYSMNFAGLSVLSIAVQVLAGSQILSLLLGWSVIASAFAMVLIALSYSIYRGFNASVVTDVVQYVIMLGASTALFLMADTSNLNFNGLNGDITSFFSGAGWQVFLAFGIPVTLGLMSGPFGDGTFYQRAFAIQKDKVKKAFYVSGFVFGIIPLLLGALGFAAVGSGFVASAPSQIGIEFIQATLPTAAVSIFFSMIVVGLLSTIDSHASFLSSFSHDKKKQKLLFLIPALIAIGISSIPGMTVTILFLFYGIFRASSLITNMLYTWGVKLKESTIFYSVFLNLILAFLPFAYGNWYKITWLKIVGVVLILTIPLVVTMINERKTIPALIRTAKNGK